MAALATALVLSVIVSPARPGATTTRHQAAPAAAASVPPKAPEFATLAKKAAAAREGGRADEAIALYKQALAKDAEWAEGRWYLGTLLYEKDAFPAARQNLRLLVALTPQAGPAWAMLGLSEFRLGEHEIALAHLEKARELGLGGNEALIQVT